MPGTQIVTLLKVKLSGVEESYLNQPFSVDLGVKFLPEIDSLTYNKWSTAFGDYSITDKLLKIIDDEVSREGSFEIQRGFDTDHSNFYGWSAVRVFCCLIKKSTPCSVG